jgi:hypothetical protein
MTTASKNIGLQYAVVCSRMIIVMFTVPIFLLQLLGWASLLFDRNTSGVAMITSIHHVDKNESIFQSLFDVEIVFHPVQEMTIVQNITVHYISEVAVGHEVDVCYNRYHQTNVAFVDETSHDIGNKCGSIGFGNAVRNLIASYVLMLIALSFIGMSLFTVYVDLSPSIPSQPV